MTKGHKLNEKPGYIECHVPRGEAETAQMIHGGNRFAVATIRNVHQQTTSFLMPHHRFLEIVQLEQWVVAKVRRKKRTCEHVEEVLVLATLEMLSKKPTSQYN